MLDIDFDSLEASAADPRRARNRIRSRPAASLIVNYLIDHQQNASLQKTITTVCRENPPGRISSSLSERSSGKSLRRTWIRPQAQEGLLTRCASRRPLSVTI
jgi:hypothetical protein